MKYKNPNRRGNEEIEAIREILEEKGICSRVEIRAKIEERKKCKKI